MIGRIGIGTKILLVVGLVFLLFSIVLVTMIGTTSFRNLTQIKQAELTRTSQILVGQIAQMERNAAVAARRFEESEPIVAELQLVADLGPYYTEPGSFFAADFADQGGEIENADQIYLFQSQLKLIQLLLPTEQINNFSSIRFYLLSPFDLLPDADPALLLHLGRETITVAQFQREGQHYDPIYHTIATTDFEPPTPNYFGISSAYAFPPADFYRELHFDLDEGAIAHERYERSWRTVDVPRSEFVIEDGVPVLQTWYPVRVPLAHPETWEEALAPVGIVQITQALDSVAMAALAEQLGLDIAFGRSDNLIISTLPLGAEANGLNLPANSESITLAENAYTFAWEPVALAHGMADLQAVVLSPVSELAGLTAALRRQIVQLAVITVLLAGVLLYLGLNSLLNRPLSALMDGVERITHGNLNHSVTVSAKDEVGQLAVAFNDMAGQLRDLIASLEQRVADRTYELTEANRAAELARRKAEQANQAKSEFLSQVSHELRTPLNGILGYTQILRKDRHLNAQQLNGLTVIQQSGEHLLTLINDILDLAKIEAQKMELLLSPVYLPSFVDAPARIFRFRAEQKGLTFGYDAATIPPLTVNVDERRLRQIIINLLSNAIRYTEQGNVNFRIVTLAMQERGPSQPTTSERCTCTLRILVEDSGVGMSHDELAHIFTPFEQQGKPQQREKGTGLGLAISQNLARLMGSRIMVESEPGKGSLFWFDLTAEQIDAAAPQPNLEQQVIVGYEPPQRTILVVDDNQINRRLIIDLLTPLGFRVIEAADGQQAIHLVVEQRPDLVLMDLRMPEFSGLDATRAIRALTTNPNGMEAIDSPNNMAERAASVVIIAASASAFERDRMESLVAGCDGFLAKPVQAPALYHILEEYLQLRWLYEEPIAATAEALPHDGNSTLVLPPPETMEKLLELAQRGMMRNLREEAERLLTHEPRYRPFAEQIRTLAQNLQEKELLALIEGQMVSK